MCHYVYYFRALIPWRPKLVTLCVPVGEYYIWRILQHVPFSSLIWNVILAAFLSHAEIDANYFSD